MFNYIIPVIVVIIIVYGIYKKVDIFDNFLIGVKEGIKLSISLFPTIFAMIIAINLLLNSGIIMDISRLFSKSNNISLFPLAILRSVSGSASLTYLNELFSKYGPDSFIGRLSSVMQGSTDTTIYIISLYFSSVGIKKINYSLIVGLLADFISIILSIFVVKLVF